ncbi:hypothetical protein HYZ97_04735 [Candidatus Pacearchaeota archaeon]|nr:hypothetical protein [Candidatus Pacearchaeota archaeon]
MLNKRGAAHHWVVGIFIVALLISVLVAIMSSPVWDKITAAASTPVDTSTSSFAVLLGNGWVFLDYIFGKPAAFLTSVTSSQYSPLIITIAIWLMLFITFGDIIATFGTFSEKIYGWLLGFLLAVIAANLKAVVYMIAFSVGLFSALGSAAVLLGVGTSFFVFLAVNFGLKQFGPFIMRRRAMYTAATAEIKAEAGGKKLAGTIKGLGAAGKALEKI